MAAIDRGRSAQLGQVTIIRPRRGWAALDLAELWSHRELAWFLVWRDLKVRYKQTAFGALWALMQPLLLMAVFVLVLGRLSGFTSANVPYALFALAGLVPWTLFSQGVVAASTSLVEAASVLQKVYFPRLLLPLAATGSFLVDFGIGLVLLLVLQVGLGVAIPLSAIALVPLTLLLVLTALASGVWLAAINVRYRDVRYAVPFVVQLWLFLSPVAYPVSVLPSEWRPILALNPVTGILEGFRWALFGGDFPLSSLVASVIVTAIVLGLGLAYFRRVERTFADVI